MARRLKTIARWVNENLGSYGYHATVEPHYYGYTVGKIGRLIGYSGERYGNLFECWELTDLEDKYNEPNTYRRRKLRQFSGMEGVWRRIYSHNTAEPYRNNAEVESFVRGLVKRIREENPDADVANYEAEEFGAEYMRKGWKIDRIVPRYMTATKENPYRHIQIHYNKGDYEPYLIYSTRGSGEYYFQTLSEALDWLDGEGRDFRNAEEFGAERYEPTEQEMRLLVKNLRAIWIKYEKGVYDYDDMITKMERLLYHTGVMQEGYAAEEFEAEGEEDWRERFFKNPQVLTRNGKDIALVDDRTRSGNFGGITIIHPIEGGDSQDGWYGDTTQIVYSNGKLDYIEMPGGERAYADEMKTHYAEEFGADFMPNEMGDAPDGWNKYEPSNDEDDYTDRMWKFIDDNLGYNYFISSDDEDEVRRFRKDLYDWMGETSNYVRTAYNAEEFGAEYDDDEKRINGMTLDEWLDEIDRIKATKEPFYYSNNILGSPKYGNMIDMFWEQGWTPQGILDAWESYDRQEGHWEKIRAETFQSETQATVISSLVSLGALGVGILLGKKLFFDEKVLG